MQLSQDAILVSRHDLQLADGIIRCAERDLCFHKKHVCYDEDMGECLSDGKRRDLLKDNTNWDSLYVMTLVDLLYFAEQEALLSDKQRRGIVVLNTGDIR